MSRRPKNPLRPLLEEERQQLMRLSRGSALRPAQWPVPKRCWRSRMAATHRCRTGGGSPIGRCGGRLGGALQCRRFGGGDSTPRWRASTKLLTRERERILAEARRSPDREQDGTAVWSLLTLQRAMRRNG